MFVTNLCSASLEKVKCGCNSSSESDRQEILWNPDQNNPSVSSDSVYYEESQTSNNINEPPAQFNQYPPRYCGNSPLEIRSESTTSIDLPPITWHGYNCPPQLLTISNTGRKILIEGQWASGKPYIQGGPLNGSYMFSQIHFHYPSEHEIDGKRYPLEMHVVHFKTSYLTQERAMEEKDGTIVLVYLFQAEDLSCDTVLSHFTKKYSYIQTAHTQAEITGVTLGDLVKPFYSHYYIYWGSISSGKNCYLLQWIINCTNSSATKQEVHDLYHLMLCCESSDKKRSHFMKPVNNAIYYAGSYSSAIESLDEASTHQNDSHSNRAFLTSHSCQTIEIKKVENSRNDAQIQASSSGYNLHTCSVGPDYNYHISSAPEESLPANCPTHSHCGHHTNNSTQIVFQTECSHHKSTSSQEIPHSSCSNYDNNFTGECSNSNAAVVCDENNEKKKKMDKKYLIKLKDFNPPCDVLTDFSFKKTSACDNTERAESSPKLTENVKLESSACEIQKDKVKDKCKSSKTSTALKALCKAKILKKSGEKKLKSNVAEGSNNDFNKREEPQEKRETPKEKPKKEKSKKKLQESKDTDELSTPSTTRFKSKSKSKSKTQIKPDTKIQKKNKNVKSKSDKAEESGKDEFKKDTAAGKGTHATEYAVNFISAPNALRSPSLNLVEIESQKLKEAADGSAKVSEKNLPQPKVKGFSPQICLQTEHLFHTESKSDFSKCLSQDYNVTILSNQNIIQEFKGTFSPNKLELGSCEKLHLIPKYPEPENVTVEVEDCVVKMEKSDQLCIRSKFLLKQSGVNADKGTENESLKITSAQLLMPVIEKAENLEGKFTVTSKDCGKLEGSAELKNSKLEKDEKQKRLQDIATSSNKKLDKETHEISLLKGPPEELDTSKSNILDFSDESSDKILDNKKSLKNLTQKSDNIIKHLFWNRNKTLFFTYNKVERDESSGKKIFVGKFRTESEMKALSQEKKSYTNSQSLSSTQKTVKPKRECNSSHSKKALVTKDPALCEKPPENLEKIEQKIQSSSKIKEPETENKEKDMVVLHKYNSKSFIPGRRKIEPRQRSSQNKAAVSALSSADTDTDTDSNTRDRFLCRLLLCTAQYLKTSSQRNTVHYFQTSSCKTDENIEQQRMHSDDVMGLFPDGARVKVTS